MRAKAAVAEAAAGFVTPARAVVAEPPAPERKPRAEKPPEPPQRMTRARDSSRDRLLCEGRLWIASEPDDTAQPLYDDVGVLVAKIAAEMDRQKALSTEAYAKQQRIDTVILLIEALDVDADDVARKVREKRKARLTVVA